VKRLHIHIAVDDLEKNIHFYSALFKSQPTVLEYDYAKWQLDDPRMNFAISNRGRTPGLDHLGIQVDSAAELDAVQQGLADAALPIAAQKQAACCYAQSDKYWSVDPQGIPWEAFHSLSSIPMFGDDQVMELEQVSACCKPSATGNAR
jgi:catechol 2,3-dioxygenase-like lactoylglutathione lyase family enzyme